VRASAKPRFVTPTVTARSSTRLSLTTWTLSPVSVRITALAGTPTLERRAISTDQVFGHLGLELDRAVSDDPEQRITGPHRDRPESRGAPADDAGDRRLHIDAGDSVVFDAGRLRDAR